MERLRYDDVGSLDFTTKIYNCCKCVGFCSRTIDDIERHSGTGFFFESGTNIGQ